MARISYFLGANTPNGFYSLMDKLLAPGKARAVYILKGGPGCGKSSLMKKVGQRCDQAGLDTEYIYCSGDPDSLDGVVVPSLGAAIVDGTAPHVVEPSLPAVVERYVNLGECYDTRALAPQRERVAQLMEGYQSQYRRAYRCLKGAGQLLEDNRELLETQEFKDKARKRAKGIIAREIPKHGPGGEVSERFLDAVSCQGQVCFSETVETLCKRVYALVDSYGRGHVMLEELLGAAVERGHRAVACPDPMAPKNLRHLLLPDLGVGFVTSDSRQPYPGETYRRIRLDAMAAPEVLRRYKARLKFSRKVAAALLEEGMETLAAGKKLHDELEGVYNPHVDFDRVYATAQAVGDEILALEPVQ